MSKTKQPKVEYGAFCISMAMSAAVLTLIPELAMAATTTVKLNGADVTMTELNNTFDTIKTMLSGPIGKITAGVSLALGVIACVAKWNVMAIGTPFGVALAAVVGPKVIDTVLGAVF